MSKLRVNDVIPANGLNIGIGTAGGNFIVGGASTTVVVNGTLNSTGNSTFDGSVGVGTDNPEHKFHLYTGTLGIGKSENTGFEITLDNNNLTFSRDSKSYINQVGSGTISVRLGSSYTEVAEFTSDGLKLPSGNGIDFSATSDAAGMNNELLDDYEEGTWTPDIRGSTPGTGSFSPNAAGNGGIYRKIGGLVFIQGNLRGTWTNGTASGNLELTGLPITNRGTISGENNANYSPVNISYYSGLTPSVSGYYVQGGLVLQGSTYIHLYANNGNGGGQVNLAITDVSTANDGVNYHFSATYASA